MFILIFLLIFIIIGVTISGLIKTDDVTAAIILLITGVIASTAMIITGSSVTNDLTYGWKIAISTILVVLTILYWIWGILNVVELFPRVATIINVAVIIVSVIAC